ncbi:hypothetical protein [Actinoplanes sp. NPDC051411]|uniref:hypothetical protein n=1 Tax=Actinoplanes sp. NPDC051411 TaxID=3155522 RepID=UPI0034124E4C
MWLFLLVVAAGSALLPVHASWVLLPAAALAYVAGRKLASLAAAVGVFAVVAGAGLASRNWCGGRRRPAFPYAWSTPAASPTGHR